MPKSSNTKSSSAKPAKIKTAEAKDAVAQPAWIAASSKKVEDQLVAKYGEAERTRVQRGVKQVAEFWRTSDGDAKAFEEFVTTNFAGTQGDVDTLFARFEYLTEKLYGHMQEINREFRQQADLDMGKIMPYDEVFAAYSTGGARQRRFFPEQAGVCRAAEFSADHA